MNSNITSRGGYSLPAKYPPPPTHPKLISLISVSLLGCKCLEARTCQSPLLSLVQGYHRVRIQYLSAE